MNPEPEPSGNCCEPLCSISTRSERLKAIGGVFRKRRMFLPVQVIVEGIAPAVAFVGHGHAGGFAERHRPIAVPAPAVRRYPDRKGDEGLVNPMTDPEEIADRALDARV